MGRGLLRRPAFRAALEDCEAVIAREAGFSVLATLEGDGNDLGCIHIVQPVLFALQVGLAAEWRALGVVPDAVVGHSMGEVAAACVAGALSLEDAARVVCRRSRLLGRVSGQGAMALVELTMADAERVIAGRPELSVAVANGPRSTVIAGDPAALDGVLVRLEAAGVFCRRVKVDVASHSPQVDPLRSELLEALADVAPRVATLPMRSTVTGEILGGPELNAIYWADNLRQPVRFSQATLHLIADGHRLFLELSPHPILVPAIVENGGVALPSLRRDADAELCLHDSLGALWADGGAVDWTSLHPVRRPVVAVPPYPWHRERYWLDVKPRAPDPLADAALDLEWRRVEAPAPSARPGPWLVVGNGGDELVAALGAVVRARDVVEARPHFDRCCGVIDLQALGQEDPQAVTHAALALMQALARHGFRDPPPVWLVTRGRLAQAPLVGLARALALELPELAPTLVELDVDSPLAEVVLELGTRGEHVVRHGTDRRVARLVRGRLPDAGDFAAVPDATYLITGGFGALGGGIARWLVERGARNLALVGRNAKVVQIDGARVVSIAADVSVRTEVERTLDTLAGLPPLRGVVHAAGVVDDRTLVELGPEHVARVFAPKVAGAHHLDALTRALPLDFFVLCSSAAALLGSPGQANYCAASAFLDALAKERRAAGFPATSIQWGPIAGVGLAAASGARLAERGVGGLTLDEALRAFGRLLNAPSATTAVVRFDARQWLEFYPAATTLPLYRELAAAPTPSLTPSFAPRLAEAAPADRLALVEDHVRREVARVLRLDPARIDRAAPFTSLGMDSLMSLELRNRIEAAFGLRLSATLVYTYPTVAQLADGLLDRLAPGSMSPAADVDAALLAELDALEARLP
jgi:malonyl CoA-acyl carrier protein transacylase/NAD(P)-dependent dehydrogenase (short-subunit alcohol dehydrogenase family)